MSVVQSSSLQLHYHSISYIRYLLNIIPNYIFYGSFNHICILHFNTTYLKLMFYFIYKHHNTQSKLFIDLTTADFLAYKRRFLNIYNLLSLEYNSRIFLKTWVSKYHKIESLSFLYKNSNWYERESWDMFGVLYLNHPDLRRILTDYGFKGYPLRKDFPLTGFVELKYDSISKRISYKPISLVQEYRTFKINSQWHYFE